MSVKIRKMTNNEYVNMCQWSITQHAIELTEKIHIPLREAIRESTVEFNTMLPDGLNTKHNYFMTIIEAESKENVGYIWTIHEETEGRKQIFICDFAIWESQRGKGYAIATLNLLEHDAAKKGCQEIVLFVSDINHVAKALYQKCGYQIQRQADYGKYMVKQLK